MRKSWALLATAGLALAATQARAAENATGIYLLGIKASMAGFLPPPGTYVTDINYYYSGDASGTAAAGVALRRTGNLTIEADIDVTGNAYINLPLALWVAPQKVLGGNVGLGVMTPYGWKNVDVAIDALATLQLPDGTTIDLGRHLEFEDSTTNFGDPVLNALIGWHEGNWHWNVGALLNVPVGPWDTESISNLSFHRWALDTSASVTYLDAKRGHELSMTAGTLRGQFDGRRMERSARKFGRRWLRMHLHPLKCLARHPRQKIARHCWQLPTLVVDLTTEVSSSYSTQIKSGVQMTFELYTAERERCAEDLFAVTMKMGEIEEALVLEAEGGTECSRLEAALELTRAESGRLEDRLLQLDGSLGSR